MKLKIKNFKAKILSILALITLVSVQLEPFTNLISGANALQFSANFINKPFTDSRHDGYSAGYYDAYLGSNFSYCTDYGRLLPGSVMTYQQDLSPQAASVLINGYPNVSPAALGVANASEAISVTQLAFWEVVSITGEGTKAAAFDFSTLSPNAGYEDYYNRTIPAAKKLASKALNNPYSQSPKISIAGGSAKTVHANNQIIAGPYAVNLTDANTNTINLSLQNAPASAVITDFNGNAKTSVTSGEHFYVRVADTENSGSLTVNAHANGTYYIGRMYTSNNSADQNYSYLEKQNISLDSTLPITWTGIKSNIELLKIDTQNNPLKGATFELRDTSGKVLDKAVTGDDGYVRFKNVNPGNYKLVEVASPTGYILDGSPIEVNVTAGQTFKATFTNQKEDLTTTGTLKIVKTTDDKTPLADVKFQILDANKKVVDTILTNSQGIATSKKLALGTYYYKEIEAPSNVVMDSKEYEFKLNTANQVITKNVENKVIKSSLKIIKVDENNVPLEGVTFKITDKNGKVVDTLVTGKDGIATSKELEKGTYYYQETKAPAGVIIDSNKYEFTVTEDGQNVIKNIENKLVKGKIEFLKIDQDKNPIEGVKFQILDSNKNVIETITTGKDGKASSKELFYGKYYYKEVEAPNNVIMDTKVYEFNIKTDNQVISKTVVNKVVNGTLRIIKVDENDVPLAGVTFEITDKNGKVVDTLVTGKDGIATSKELEKGTYYYQEIKAPAGIVIDNNKYEFTINENGQNVIKNIKNNFAKGKIEILKVDTTNTPIEGVKFDILDANKKVVQTITTDKEGRASSTELVYGKYYYKEVEAPEGIVMDTKEYEFNIKTNNQVISKTVVNKKVLGSLKIVKLDKNSKEPISDVTFDILNSNKEVIATVTTDVNGIATVGNMPKGTYYYKEVKAPSKYIVDNKQYSFDISTNGQVVEKVVYNQAKTLPVTGGFISTNGLIVLLTTLISIIGYAVLNVISNKRKLNSILSSENDLIV